jgi:hypothetical protein
MMFDRDPGLRFMLRPPTRQATTTTPGWVVPRHLERWTRRENCGLKLQKRAAFIAVLYG